jgi:hypothetical protein
VLSFRRIPSPDVHVAIDSAPTITYIGDEAEEILGIAAADLREISP